MLKFLINRNNYNLKKNNKLINNNFRIKKIILILFKNLNKKIS